MDKKKDMNIKSYDGQDAFYTGSDAEYEEFLKNADVRIDGGEAAEPVENTRKINLGETINLQNVIDKFKKTAGGWGHTVKENVANKMDMLKTAKEESSLTDENGDFDLDAAKEAVSEKIQSSVQSSERKLNELKDEMHAIADVPDSIDAISSKLEALSSKLAGLEELLQGDKKDNEQLADDIKETLKTASDNITDIKQAVGAVSKLNDSVFDLKNTQLNTKNAVSNLETAFARLKKKCVLGVTVLSILSAIVIVLEILLMLS